LKVHERLALHETNFIEKHFPIGKQLSILKTNWLQDLLSLSFETNCVLGIIKLSLEEVCFTRSMLISLTLNQ